MSILRRQNVRNVNINAVIRMAHNEEIRRDIQRFLKTCQTRRDIQRNMQKNAKTANQNHQIRRDIQRILIQISESDETFSIFLNRQKHQEEDEDVDLAFFCLEFMLRITRI